MNATATNYARNIHTRALVFFDKAVPDVVKAQPEAWATWFVTNVDLARRIGESSDHYCRRNGHRPRKCLACATRQAAA